MIRTALIRIGELPSTRLASVSPFYRTEPVGHLEQGWFVNAAAVIETALDPRPLLDALLGIERSMGRVRKEKWGPRLIDLDILFYGQAVIDEPDLVVPHAFMDRRRFVLAPLADVAPDWRHPLLGLTPGEMLARLPENGQEAHRL
ncbi:MAG: 2-amino-4-hydroxy-6-hydroxymethyldihydropteridine diphosphokinase [Proteobacteria bacterium]|nr:2-amino-4-hydroxy-6-hydroxymethyldihydropteridine diphosphokinase [Pseudomonadota bacterium]